MCGQSKAICCTMIVNLKKTLFFFFFCKSVLNRGKEMVSKSSLGGINYFLTHYHDSGEVLINSRRVRGV